MKIKEFIAASIVTLTFATAFSLSVSADYFKSSGTFSADGGSATYSNTGSVSWGATTVKSNSISLDYMINGVCYRYVNAYIEKDSKTGTMTKYKDLGGNLPASTRKTGSMSRSSSDASGTVYSTNVVVYTTSSSKSPVADSYFYYATIR